MKEYTHNFNGTEQPDGSYVMTYTCMDGDEVVRNEQFVIDAETAEAFKASARPKLDALPVPSIDCFESYKTDRPPTFLPSDNSKAVAKGILNFTNR